MYFNPKPESINLIFSEYLQMAIDLANGKEKRKSKALSTAQDRLKEGNVSPIIGDLL